MTSNFIIDRRHLLASSSILGLSLLGPQKLWALASKDELIIEASPSKASLLGDANLPVDVWAYSNKVPGPEIRVKQGDEVRVRLVNKLPEPTTIHWHGIRIKNDMDGVPDLTQKPVQPGESFDYRFRVPDAGTFWYHTHNRSWEQMAKGLYGTLIVEERDPPNFARDYTLVIDDWRLTERGQIDLSTFGSMMDHSHAGRYGNWVTVNGLSQPVFKIPREAPVRLRLINTCNSRILKLKIPDLNVFLIAVDGQPIPPSEKTNQEYILGPAQRIDLSVIANAGTPKQIKLIETSNRRQTLQIASFDLQAAADKRQSSLDNPLSLPVNPISTELDPQNAVRAQLKMQGGAMGRLDSAIYRGESLGIRQLVKTGQVWAFNGIVGMTKNPLLSAKRGQTVIIDIINDTAWPHSMHLHGHHFQVFKPNDKSTNHIPWIDTLLVSEEETVSIVFVADNPGKWLFHCHMLEHQASGMKTWINVEA